MMEYVLTARRDRDSRDRRLRVCGVALLVVAAEAAGGRSVLTTAGPESIQPLEASLGGLVLGTLLVLLAIPIGPPLYRWLRRKLPLWRREPDEPLPLLVFPISESEAGARRIDAAGETNGAGSEPLHSPEPATPSWAERAGSLPAAAADAGGPGSQEAPAAGPGDHPVDPLPATVPDGGGDAAPPNRNSRESAAVAAVSPGSAAAVAEADRKGAASAAQRPARKGGFTRPAPAPKRKEAGTSQGGADADGRPAAGPAPLAERAGASSPTPSIVPTDDGWTETLQLLPGRLEIVSGVGSGSGQEIRFVRSGPVTEVTLGRADTKQPGHVRIPAPTVSRRHALLRFENGAWKVANLSETNPLRLNGQELSGNRIQALASGDRLEIGDVVLIFHEL